MSAVLIGERYLETLGKALINQGFSPFGVPDNPDIDTRIASHVDLSIFDAGGTLILCKNLEGNASIVNYLTSRGISFIFAESKQTAVYSGDAGLCACAVGKRLICNEKSCDGAITARYADHIISVKQGYTRCAVCVVDDHSIITADRGIAAAATKHGLDVLLIRAGGFTLEGFPEGFIGGSSFRYSDTVYFTGVLDAHPDKDKIIAFTTQRSLKIVYLTNLPAFDIGGAVFV